MTSLAVPTDTLDLPRRDILGVPVVAVDGKRAREVILRAAREGRHARYAFLNAHGANTAVDDPRFRDVLRGFTVLPDGAGVDMASRWLHGRPFPENLNGTDFVPFLLREAPPLSVGLWGAEPGVADEAAAAWKRSHSQHDYAVLAHGFVAEAERDAVLEALTRRRVDLLLVAMGNPTQEFFIQRHVDARHAGIVMGVGALFDFTAGRKPRAPEALRRVRLEWVFRLALEPRRMFRRYVVGNPMFLARVARSGRRG